MGANATKRCESDQRILTAWQSREELIDGLVELLKAEWEKAIEKRRIEGMFRRAMRVYRDSDINALIESLHGVDGDHLTEMVGAWRKFAKVWAHKEAIRIYKDMMELDRYVRKAPWKRARAEAARKKTERFKLLKSQIVLIVLSKG